VKLIESRAPASVVSLHHNVQIPRRMAGLRRRAHRDAAGHGYLLVVGRYPSIHPPEILRVGVEAEKLPDGPDVRLDAGLDLPPECE
jgi:hypothetical protein